MVETPSETSARIIASIGQATRSRQEALDAIRELTMRRDEMDAEINSRTIELKAIFGENALQEQPEDGRKKKMKYFEHPARKKAGGSRKRKAKAVKADNSKNGKYECKECGKSSDTLHGIKVHGYRMNHKTGFEKA